MIIWLISEILSVMLIIVKITHCGFWILGLAMNNWIINLFFMGLKPLASYTHSLAMVCVYVKLLTSCQQRSKMCLGPSDGWVHAEFFIAEWDGCGIHSFTLFLSFFWPHRWHNTAAHTQEAFWSIISALHSSLGITLITITRSLL